MKTKEELNALKEEVGNVNKKLNELTEDELRAVTGGSKQNEEELAGEVIAVLSETIFQVSLIDGRVIEAYLIGRLKAERVAIIAGSQVLVKLSAYDTQSGKIIRIFQNS